MRSYKVLALAVFFTGLALFLAGVVTGDTKVYLAVIIPVIETTSLLSIAGILLMFGAFFLWAMGSFSGIASGTAGHAPGRMGDQASPVTRPRARTKAGGIILIGPVPILFANDKRLAIILMILGIVLVAAVAALMLFIL
jgi:uncharacterized protein (TIGR00304 family)